MSKTRLFIVHRLGSAYRPPGVDVPAETLAVVQAPSAAGAVQVFEGRFAEHLPPLEQGEFLWAQEAFQAPREARVAALNSMSELFKLNAKVRAQETLDYLARHPRGNPTLREICLRWPDDVRQMQREELRFIAKVLEVEHDG